MSTGRHILLASAFLVAGCAAGPTDFAESIAQDEVPNAWRVLEDDVAAPSPTPAVAPLDESDATAAGNEESVVGVTPTPQPVPFGSPLPPAGGTPEVTEVLRPVNLRLPSLGIEGAAVRSVGVEPDGAMEIPSATEVGWYRFGPGPGQAGSQVLAAHIASDGIDGVFRNLDRLQQGDRVEVIDEAGVMHEYEIVGLGEFEKEELPFDLLFDRGGSERLALITCGGDFNPQLGSYESNVVAFAVPVSA